MKKVFTLIAVAALVASCGMFGSKKAAETTEATEVVATECVCAEGGECTCPEGTCDCKKAEGEAAPVEGEVAATEVVVAE